MIKFTGNVQCPKSVIIVAAAANAKEELKFGGIVVTSMNDSVHMRGSAHYRDEAVDFRTHDLAHADVERWADVCRRRLGSSYQVIVEVDHLHIELETNHVSIR